MNGGGIYLGERSQFAELGVRNIGLSNNSAGCNNKTLIKNIFLWFVNFFGAAFGGGIYFGFESKMRALKAGYLLIDSNRAESNFNQCLNTRLVNHIHLVYIKIKK